MTERIRALWSDFGGVLTPPIGHTMSIFCARVGVAPEAFRAAMRTVAESYGTDDPMEVLDTPLADERDWSAQMEKVLLAEHDSRVDLSDFADKWFTDRQTNEPWLDQLARLRSAGLFVGMLSNMVPSWDEYWRAMVPPESFDDVVLSFQVGSRKPDPAIFALAARRARLDPAQCLLVDDLDANCAGAVRAGWRAVRFTDTDQAIDELRRVLL